MPVRQITATAPSGVDTSEVERIVAEHVGPVAQAAAHAEATGQNARDMVLRRDAKLNQASTDAAAAISEASTLQEIAASYAAALPASVADRQALHAQADAQKAALDALTARVAAMPTPVDYTNRVTALEAAVAVLQALKVRVAFGSTVLSGQFLAGATRDVVVTLSQSMGSAYSHGYSLQGGGTGILGSVVVDGVTATTATTVTVRIRNTGLAAIASLAATVHVVAAKDA